jgi:hypothetical protein
MNVVTAVLQVPRENSGMSASLCRISAVARDNHCMQGIQTAPRLNRRPTDFTRFETKKEMQQVNKLFDGLFRLAIYCVQIVDITTIKPCVMIRKSCKASTLPSSAQHSQS